MNDLLLVLIVLLVIVVILRGPKTLPQIGRMFGQGVREAREEINKAQHSDGTAAGAEPPADNVAATGDDARTG